MLSAEINPGAVKLPKVVAEIAAGRHCHKFFVEASGIKLASCAIAPWNTFDESSASDNPVGENLTGVPLRIVTVHQPMFLVFGKRLQLVCPKNRRSSSTRLVPAVSGSSFIFRYRASCACQPVGAFSGGPRKEGARASSVMFINDPAT